jgi:excinuclease ABC subunit C
VYRLDQYIELIDRLFPLRKCRKAIKKREHPCLYYHIGRCAAVCAGKTSHDEYAARVDGIRKLLSGDTDALIERLETDMSDASERLEFERAATLRDTIESIRTSHEEQQVVDFDPESRDYIGWYERDGLASVTVLHLRAGRLLGTENFHLDVYAPPDEYVEQFAAQYYQTAASTPEKLIVGLAREQLDAITPSLAQLIAEQTGRAVEILFPETSRDASVIRLAEENARRDYDKRVRERGNTAGLEELQTVLELATLPLRIEGFDIAHVAGTHPVASLVVFVNGRPEPSEYRRYHMRTLDGRVDDFAAMREVVARRYTRVVNDGLAAPDLILIDGGKGQVSAAVAVLKALELAIPVVGLAKREEELFLPGRSESIRLPEGSEPLRVLQAVRDEAHRFATTFRASLQSGDLSDSELLSVPGIGPKRSRRILERFESLSAIAGADVERSGGVAQLARVREWHSRGHGFESRHLHSLYDAWLQDLTAAQSICSPARWIRTSPI